MPEQKTAEDYLPPFFFVGLAYKNHRLSWWL